MPFLLTKQNADEIRTDAKVFGACPYRSPNRNQGWHPDLWAEQRRIQEMAPGESMLTSGVEFDAKCGIITVPPIWEGGNRKEALRLAACYDSALRLAHRRRCKSIAFPLLSSDCHGFPKDLALKTAIEAIRDFLERFEMTVYLSVREPSVLQLFDDHYDRIRRALEVGDYLGQENVAAPTVAMPVPDLAACEDWDAPMAAAEAVPKESHSPGLPHLPRPAVSRSLQNLLEEQEETFSQRVLRLIDSKGLKDPQVYKRANLDRRLFSKIRSNVSYQPSKTTALALAIALELNLDETRDLIGKAGYALTRSSKADIILEYFIREGTYDIYEINQILFAFDQPLIGG